MIRPALLLIGKLLHLFDLSRPMLFSLLFRSQRNTRRPAQLAPRLPDQLLQFFLHGSLREFYRGQSERRVPSFVVAIIATASAAGHMLSFCAMAV
jgi:hypothetical protein